MPLVELSVRPGSAISISGLIRHDSSFLKEWTGSDRVHVSRPSFICPSATWPRLKPPLDLGASSTSILEPGLDGRQVLSQRLQLALFATRHFLLLPLQPFNFPFYLVAICYAFLQLLGKFPLCFQQVQIKNQFVPLKLCLVPIQICLVPFQISLVPFPLCPLQFSFQVAEIWICLFLPFVGPYHR